MAFLMCLDSLLKVNIAGFYIQAGIFFTLVILVLMCVDKKYKFETKIIKKDKTIILFFVLIGIGFPSAINLSVYFKMLFYFLIFTLMYIYVSNGYRCVGIERLSYICILVLCATGLIQYGLANIFSIQIELRGIQSNHYENLANRMRGFFLEPNWYGLILFSWLFIYVRSLDSLKFGSTSLILIAGVCLVLSGNRLIYFFLLILCIVWLFKGISENFKRMIPVVFLVLSGGLFVYLSMAGGLEGDRSAAARFYTGYNVISTMLSYPIDIQLMGRGFSNWGWFSNELELSWSNYLFDQSLTRRDNSEIYVILFEMGYLGALLFVYDSWFLGGKKEADILDIVYVVCMYVAGMFYPIYQFLMYMVPLMIVRSRVVNSN